MLCVHTQENCIALISAQIHIKNTFWHLCVYINFYLVVAVKFYQCLLK